MYTVHVHTLTLGNWIARLASDNQAKLTPDYLHILICNTICYHGNQIKIMFLMNFVFFKRACKLELGGGGEPDGNPNQNNTAMKYQLLIHINKPLLYQHMV